MLEEMLINAVIASRDFSVLIRHGVNNAESFRDYPCVYKYISDHLRDFGELPSVESTIMSTRCECKGRKCPEFTFVDVTESSDTLCMKLIERNLKLDEKALLTSLAAEFGVKDGYTILERLRAFVDEATTKSMKRSNAGVNWSTNGAERRQEYEQRKQREYGTKIPLLFEDITEATGGAELGEVIVIMAALKRGKSWLGNLQSLVSNKAGYKVLIESAEMSKPENLFRLDTIDGKFSNRGLWTGRLTTDAETEYTSYLETFQTSNGRPDLVIKTPEDWPNGLTLEQLEYDIRRTGAQVVIIDQFNLMRFKSSSRDDKASMSRQLKQLAARLGVVVVLLYQANGDYVKGTTKTTEDEGIRELTLPNTGDYSETIAVVQDANKVIGFDAVTWRDDKTGRQRGKALIGVLESRSGGGGTEVELEWCPNDGVMEPRKPTDVF